MLVRSDVIPARRLSAAAHAVLACVAVTIAAAAACSNLQPERSESAAEGRSAFGLDELRGDLEQLEMEVLSRHPFPLGNRDEVAERLRSCYDQVRDGMGAWEFFRVLSPAVSLVRCGHTSLAPSPAMEAEAMKRRQLLPLRIIAVGDRLYALQDFSSAGIPPGSEILRVNARPAAEIIKTLLANMSADGWNLTGKYQQMNRALAVAYGMYIEFPKSFSVEYAPPDAGIARRAELRPGTIRPHLSAAGRDAAAEGSASPPYAGSVEEGRAVLRIASFGFYDAPGRAKFEAFVDGFFDSIAAAGARDLILDLRGNGGGDPHCAAFLLARLISEEFAYFSADTPGYPDLKAVRPARNCYSGSLYALIDGGCFSTAGHLCSLLRYHGRCVFVGEETGGSFACTDNSVVISLGRTGMRLKLSRTVYATAARGLAPGRGILPDYEVVPTIAERLAGFDAPMAFARQLVESGAEARTAR